MYSTLAEGLLSRSLAALMVLCVASSMVFGESIPGEGLKAEGEKRWGDAVSIYKAAIAEDAGRGDLWVRIAQIEGARGDKKAAAEAWENASAQSPEDNELLFNTAKAHAAAGNGLKALEAAEKALELEPKHVELLQARAMYANWVGKPDVAADSYRRILDEDPDNQGAAKALKAMEAGSAPEKDYNEIAQSIQEKIKSSRDNPALYAELAQVYSMANEPAKALEAIGKAVELQPGNIDYLRARGQYANWIGKLETAEDSYIRILKIEPDDASATLGLARAKSWSGNLNESLKLFRKYIELQPDDSDALMDYIKVQSWSGNYSAAMDGLDLYKDRFSETVEYKKQRARLLASAGKSAAAHDLINPLLEADPIDYEMLFTRAVAFHNSRQQEQAMRSLEQLETIRPNSPDNAGLRRFITSGSRDSVKASGEYYIESDVLDIETYRLQAGAQLLPSVRLIAGKEWKELRADQGSGLESPDGQDSTSSTDAWAGMNWLVLPQVSLTATIGHTDTDTIEVAERETMVSFRGILDLRLADSLSVSYVDDKHIYAVSPRAAAQGIYRRDQAVRIIWTPGLKYTIDVGASQAKFSDLNRQWEAYIAPRRAVVRNEDLNMDIGVFLWWQAFEDQEFRGYYAPELYERYALKANGYYKLSANSGIAMSLVAGLQRDETFDELEFGASGDAEGQFSLSPDWMLKVRAGYTHNMNSASGDFDAQVYSVGLERKF